MPTPLAWTLIAPPAASSGTTQESSLAAPFLPGPVDALPQQHFLDLLDRLLPDHFLEPLKSPGPGYEILQAEAAVGARLSQAVTHFAKDAYILSSSGGSKATGVVEFYRPTANAEGITVTILKGTVVRSSFGGRSYKTTLDAVFPFDELGPIAVTVEAVFQGYEYNEPGITVTADGSALDGEIDTIVTLVEEPPVGDITFQVRHPSATFGGSDAALDLHGKDRKILRGVGEADEPYRNRIRSIPDNISPNAIDRTLQQLLLPFNVSYSFIETFEIGYQTCWDAPADPIPGSQYDPSTFVFDDNRNLVPFRNRWLDENEMRGAFIVTLPKFGPLNDYGMAYDDTGITADDFVNEFGSRSLSVWDAPFDLAFGFLLGCWDGFDLTHAASVKTLYETLQNIKAGGIAAVVELEGS